MKQNVQQEGKKFKRETSGIELGKTKITKMNVR